MKTVTKHTAALVGSLAIAAMLGEVVERVVAVAPSASSITKGRYRLSQNTEIGFEPTPNLAATQGSLHFFDYREKSNSLGYRDYEHDVVNRDGRYRIVVLGDSLAAGHHIARTQDAFPAVLEATLRARGVNAEVLNFGVSGYNTQQEVATLKDRGLQFAPDLVLIAYCLNDRIRSDGGILATLVAQGKAQGAVGIGAHPLLRRSRLLQLVGFKLARYLTGTPKVYQALYRDTVQQYFGELQRLSSAHKFSVLISLFPDAGDLSKAQLPAEYAAIEQLSTTHGFEHQNLLTAIQKCQAGRAVKLHVDKYHPNVAGHKCVAEAMADTIIALRSAR